MATNPQKREKSQKTINNLWKKVVTSFKKKEKLEISPLDTELPHLGHFVLKFLEKRSLGRVKSSLKCALQFFQ